MNKILVDELNEQFNNISNKSTGMMILIAIISILLWICWVEFGVWLWGVIAVKIFGLPVLNFWQFVGLDILTTMIFGRLPIEISKEK